MQTRKANQTTKYAQQERAAQKKCTEEQLAQSKNATHQKVPDNNHREERLIENEHYQVYREFNFQDPLFCLKCVFIYL